MSINLLTIKDLRIYLTKELKSLYNENALNTLARIIIKTTTGTSGLHQLSNPEGGITEKQASEIIKICAELKTGKPYQYVLGETTFYDCIIKVNPSVLIPRPETEELVNLIIDENKGYTGEIIDFGTGSGCIAIALASKLPGASVTGIDNSENSLRLAEENAKLNNVEVSFKNGDILNFDADLVNKAGIIVSNPPYVRHSEKELMNMNVLDFEPHNALFVEDSEPLLYYKCLLEIGKSVLMQPGRIYFEINQAMGSQMKTLMDATGYSDIQILKDLNNRDRIIKGTLNG
jgi:release factor glutamine methyltransferase